jgi:hypothetical protein
LLWAASSIQEQEMVLVYGGGLSTRLFRTTRIDCLEAIVRRAGGAACCREPQFFRAPEELQCDDHHSAVQTVNMA